MSRIEPLQPPYPPELQAVFEAVMPKGVPPLTLFRVLAKSRRVFDKFRAGSLLDWGPVSLRLREIAIDRTCALNGCAYEWGVHVAFFGPKAKLTEAEVAALAARDALQHPWAADERAVIALCDELHASSRLSAPTWEALRAAFSEVQVLELIALAGFYRTVAYFANGLELEAEPFGAALPR